MKLPHLLAVAALILWVGSIWPGEFRNGKTWILLDRSPSMGLEPDLESWLKQTGLSLEEWRHAVHKKRVVSFPNPDGIDSPDLAFALSEMRKQLAPPDRFIVRTDGKALGPLPEPLDWAGIQVQTIPPQAQPRFHQVLAPSAWPSQGDLWVRVRMLRADLENGNLDIRETSQQLSSIEILNQGESWFAVRLHCDTAPKQDLELQLRWTENAGRATTSLRILPPGQSSISRLPRNTHPESVRRHLQNGEVILMASPTYLGWQDLPPDLQLFEAKQDSEESPLVVLLDISGSMEGAGLQDCREALTELQKSWTAGPIWVYPFQQDLLDGFLLGEAGGLEKLSNLRAFGPTNLQKALAAIAPRLTGMPALLVLSDGAAGEPESDWTVFLKQTMKDTAVYCLPAGDHADWEFLSGLGVVLEEGQLSQRLEQALQDLFLNDIFAVQPVTPASFPLPDTWIPGAAYPPLQASDGVEALLEDPRQSVYLAARRVGPGLLLGMADEFNEEHRKLLEPIAQHFQAPGHSGWVGERFLIQSSSTPPKCFQDGIPLQVSMLDPDTPVIWQAQGATPLKPVRVQFDNGRHWTASALTTPEFGNSPQLWNSWQENLRNELTGPVFRPRLLWAGLIMMTLAFVLRKLSHR